MNVTSFLPTIVKVSNVSSFATLEKMKKLFSYLGELDDIKMYPSEDNIFHSEYRVCYVKYVHPWSVNVSVHLTNTVFFDRALIVTPIHDGSIPNEEKVLLDFLNPAPALPGLGTLGGNCDLINNIAAINGQLMISTVDPKLSILSLPQYPPLLASLDPKVIEEIRRTVYIGNLNSNVKTDNLLHFLNQIVGEVKFVRMAGDDSHATRFAFVEFTDRTSIIKALQSDGVHFEGRQLKINHSSTAIVKSIKAKVAAGKEIEEAMKRVKAAEDLITATVEPEISKSRLKHKQRSRSRSRSRFRHHRRSSTHTSRSRTTSHRSRHHSRSKESLNRSVPEKTSSCGQRSDHSKSPHRSPHHSSSVSERSIHSKSSTSRRSSHRSPSTSRRSSHRSPSVSQNSSPSTSRKSRHRNPSTSRKSSHRSLSTSRKSSHRSSSTSRRPSRTSFQSQRSSHRSKSPRKSKHPRPSASRRSGNKPSADKSPSTSQKSSHHSPSASRKSRSRSRSSSHKYQRSGSASSCRKRSKTPNQISKKPEGDDKKSSDEVKAESSSLDAQYLVLSKDDNSSITEGQDLNSSLNTEKKSFETELAHDTIKGTTQLMDSKLMSFSCEETFNQNLACLNFETLPKENSDNQNVLEENKNDDKILTSLINSSLEADATSINDDLCSKYETKFEFSQSLKKIIASSLKEDELSNEAASKESPSKILESEKKKSCIKRSSSRHRLRSYRHRSRSRSRSRSSSVRRLRSRHHSRSRRSHSSSIKPSRRKSSRHRRRTSTSRLSRSRSKQYSGRSRSIRLSSRRHRSKSISSTSSVSSGK